MHCRYVPRALWLCVSCFFVAVRLMFCGYILCDSCFVAIFFILCGYGFVPMCFMLCRYVFHALLLCDSCFVAMCFLSFYPENLKPFSV